MSPTSGTKIKYQLVAGLFIPQLSQHSRQQASIIVADPSWEELETFFEEIPPNDIKLAIVAINLAKYFSLMGLGRTARFLAETPIGELTNIPEQAAQEIRTWLSTSEDLNKVLFDSEDLPVQLGPDSRQERFLVRIDRENLFRELLEYNARGVMEDLRDSLEDRQNRWSFLGNEADGTNATVRTPFSLKFIIKINEI